MALRMSRNGADQVRSKRVSISWASSSAVVTSCSLTELFNSSSAMRIMVRPATKSGTIAMTIVKRRSFLRSVNRNTALSSRRGRAYSRRLTTTGNSSEARPQTSPEPSSTISRTVYSPG